MADTKLTLSKRLVGDKAEVMIRFYGGRGIDFRAKSRIYVPVSHWDADSEKLTYNKRFITPEILALQDLESRLNEIKRAIIEEFTADPYAASSSKWLQDVIDRYHHPEQKEERILITEIIDRYIKASNLAEGTIRQHEVGRRILERFMENHGELYADNITSDDLEDLEQFLRNGDTKETKYGVQPVTRSQNTINSKMKKYAAALHWAQKKGLLSSNPFDEYEIPSDHYGTPIYLTIAERDQIAACEDMSEALKVQRDIFVFQCHVGCRVSDLYTLTPSNVTSDGFLQYIQQKMKRSNPITVRVPLDDAARLLIEKYEGCSDKLFPFISYDKYVDGIKKVIQKAGINRQVLLLDSTTLETTSKPIYEVAASHLARKTFAANIFKATKSERIASSMTGHAPHSKAFSRYSEVDDEIKASVLADMAKSADKLPT